MAKKRKSWPRPHHAEERAWKGLQELLESGAYPPGSRLPSERVMCDRFGVSRVTLRRALKRLVRANRLDARIGSGTFIKAPPPSSRRDVVSLMYANESAVPPEVRRHAAELGCELRIYDQAVNKWDPERERAFLRAARDEQHRGLLAFCTPIEPHSDSILRDLEHSGVRVLHVDHGRLTLPRQAYLLPDFRRAGHMAAVDLMLAGYRPVYWAARGGDEAPFIRLVLQGVTEALAEHRPDFDPRRHFVAFPTTEDGELVFGRQMRAIISQWPENAGAIVYSEQGAETILRIAEEMGLAVPGKLGLFTIDLAGSPRDRSPRTRADVLSFNRPHLLQRALDAILADDWIPPHELVMPTRVRFGGVREEPPRA